MTNWIRSTVRKWLFPTMQYPANLRDEVLKAKAKTEEQKEKLKEVAFRILNGGAKDDFLPPEQKDVPTFQEFAEGKEIKLPNLMKWDGKPIPAKLGAMRIPEMKTMKTVESGKDVYHKKVRTNLIMQKDALAYLKEAEKKYEKLGLTNLRESVFGGDMPQPSGTETSSGLNGVGDYLPFPPWPYTRQMYMPDQWFMISRATNAYNYSPLARAAVNIKTAFVIGNGPKIILKDPAMQEIWDETAKRIRFAERARKWDRMLSINGEHFTEMGKDKNGKSYFKSLDPGTVWEIITEPRDIEIVYGIHLLYTTQFQYTSVGARGEQVPVSEWVYEIIPPENVKHIKINVQENEKRGRSDLLPVLTVVQWFNDYLQYAVTKEMVASAYAWDISLKNADSSDIQTIISNNDVVFPKPNSTFVHNDQVTRQAVQHQGSMNTSDGVYEALVSTFCFGFGIAKEFMGASAHGSRASAITATEPTAKVFSERRNLWEDIYRAMVIHDMEVNGKTIDPDDIEVSWPELAPENITEKITNLLNLVENKMITKARATKMITKDMDISNFDYESEMQEVLQELKSDPLIQMLYPKQFDASTSSSAASPSGGDGVTPDVKSGSAGGVGNGEKAQINNQGQSL